MAGGSNTSVIASHNVSAGNPSSLKPVSNDITSASVLLVDTAVCFLHAHEIGTNVSPPNVQSMPLDVEPVKSPAKSASEGSHLPCIHWALSPT